MDDDQGGTELSPSEIEHLCNLSQVISSLKDSKYDFEFAKGNQQAYNQICQQNMKMIQEEFEQISKIIRPRPKRHFLFEVMCSPESELTRQGIQQGLLVKRFGKQEGDLSTKVGRRNLLCHLAMDRPEHVWISPSCGPWCQWSHFNMSKSAELMNTILKDRKEHIWQISLARFLCQHQVTHHRHFHCEQPQGSMMLKLSCFQPIQQETVPSTFDLCQVGDLREPISQKPIRKRLTVCTTSTALHQNLHDRKCHEKHAHHQIAGTTKVHGQSMPVSQFTELYPRKFARQIIQCLRRDKSKSLAMLAADAEDHPTKRRRLSQKSSLSQIQLMSDKITWEDIMRQVDKEAPRVGPQVVMQGLILQAVQQMCPHHHVHHLVLCRGMDHMVGPNLKISPGVAPLRKFIGIRRRFEEVVVETRGNPGRIFRHASFGDHVLRQDVA